MTYPTRHILTQPTRKGQGSYDECDDERKDKDATLGNTKIIVLIVKTHSNFRSIRFV